MKAVLIYLVQVIACSGIFYGYYHFFLKNKRFHQYNRYYLLATTTISLFIPFLKIPIYFNSQQDIPAVYKVLEEVRITSGQTTTSGMEVSWSSILPIVYSAIALILLLQLFYSIVKLAKIIRTHEKIKADDFIFLNTIEEGTPFSFLSWLFWDRKISFDSTKGRQILQHEIFHIRQRHSVDILYLECLAAVLWINPFFHRVKKEMKAIHEFSADEFAMQEGNEFEYAALLLQCAFQTNQQLVNSFFHNQIKRRIAMITNPSSTKYQYLRKGMVLPIAFLTISIVAANCKAKEAYSDIELKKTETKVTNVPLSDPKKIEVRDMQLSDLGVVNLQPTDKVYEKLEVEPAFPNGEPGWREFLQKNINANVPADNGAPAGQYICWVQFIVDKEGHLSDIQTLTNHGYGMEQEVVRMMKSSPDWVPGVDNGTTVKAYRKQPITFVIEEQ